MASMLKKIFAPLALAGAVLGLAGCGENPQDAAAKPVVVQQMVNQSLATCETGPVHADSAAYAERLGKVLSTARFSSLKTLQDHKVTVCLDQRLAKPQQTGFWYSRINGVYTPSKDGGGIMTYRDNGMQPSESGFWVRNPAYYRGYDAVNALARKFNAGTVPANGNMTVQLYGKSNYASWSKASTAPGAAINQNPQLQQPPVKAPAVKPGS